MSICPDNSRKTGIEFVLHQAHAHTALACPETTAAFSRLEQAPLSRVRRPCSPDAGHWTVSLFET